MTGGAALPMYDRAPRCAACKGRTSNVESLCPACSAAAGRLSEREPYANWPDWLRAVRREARRAAA